MPAKTKKVKKVVKAKAPTKPSKKTKKVAKVQPEAVVEPHPHDAVKDKVRAFSDQLLALVDKASGVDIILIHSTFFKVLNFAHRVNYRTDGLSFDPFQ
jgi:hypothetical protein